MHSLLLFDVVDWQTWSAMERTPTRVLSQAASAEGTFWVGLVKPPVAAMPYLANRCAARAHA